MKDYIKVQEEMNALYYVAKENFKKAFKLKGRYLMLALFCFFLYVVFILLLKMPMGTKNITVRVSYPFFGIIAYVMIGIPNFAIELFPNRLPKVFFYLPTTQKEKITYFNTYMRNKIGITVCIELLIFCVLQAILAIPVFYMVLYFLTWVEITVCAHMVISNYIQPEWREVLEAKDKSWKYYLGYVYSLFGITAVEIIYCTFFSSYNGSKKGIWISVTFALGVFVLHSIGSVLLIQKFYPSIVEMSVNYEITKQLDQTKRKR